MRLVYAVQRLLAEASGESQMLQRTCTLLARYPKYHRVGVAAKCLDGTVGLLASAGGVITGFEKLRWDPPSGPSAVINSLLHESPQQVYAADLDASYPVRAFMHRDGVISTAAFPLHLQGAVNSLFVGTHDPKGFSTSQMRLLEGLAVDLGRAIDNVRLRESLSVALGKAELRHARLEGLWRLLSRPDLGQAELAQATLDEAVALLGGDLGAIGHLERGLMVMDVTTRGDSLRHRGGEVPLDHTFAKYVIAADKTLAYDDVDSVPELREHVQRTQYGVRSWIGTPMHIRGRPYTLMIGGHTPRVPAFNDEDAAFVELLAAYFARMLEQWQQQAEITHLTSHDRLTGLPNPDRFRERLAELLEHPSVFSGRLTVLLVDVDNFGGIVHEYGHAFADRALVAIGARVERCVRNGAQVFRGRGDTFMMLAPGIGSLEVADVIGQRILSAFSAPLHETGPDLPVSVSVGIAMYPTDGADADELIEHMLAAGARAKEEGRGIVRFYDSGADDRLAERRALKVDLHKAVERNELELYYQPWIDTMSMRVRGFEALVRWNHPRLGLLEPTRFIGLAEQSQVIVPMGAWVMREATRQAREWEAAGHAWTVAVNASAAQFRDPHFAEILRAAILASAANPALLEIEITESTAMQDAALAHTLLSACKELGVRIALDDFGTGYSSLAYLKQLPVDVIKIDRSFVSGLLRDAESAAIVRAVIALGHSIGRVVHAEGVETEAEARWLASSGCDMAQGFWIGRPMPAAEVPRWFARWHRRPGQQAVFGTPG